MKLRSKIVSVVAAGALMGGVAVIPGAVAHASASPARAASVAVAPATQAPVGVGAGAATPSASYSTTVSTEQAGTLFRWIMNALKSINLWSKVKSAAHAGWTKFKEVWNSIPGWIRGSLPWYLVEQFFEWVKSMPW